MENKEFSHYKRMEIVLSKSCIHIFPFGFLGRCVFNHFICLLHYNIKVIHFHHSMEGVTSLGGIICDEYVD